MKIPGKSCVLPLYSAISITAAPPGIQVPIRANEEAAGYAKQNH